jgi:hypothetical protein
MELRDLTYNMTRTYDGQVQQILGQGDLVLDAWGRQKVINDFSMFHGLWTFDVSPKLWIEYNGVTEINITNSLNFSSNNGMLLGKSNNSTRSLRAKRHPRYQPNRGLLYSNSFIIDGATRTNGKLYACIMSNSVEYTEEIDQSILGENFVLSKGNIFDIQMQWRGVGGIRYLIGSPDTGLSEIVKHMKFLGKLEGLSISNPAMPAAFECSNQGVVKFGLFTEEDGAYFKFVFDEPRETQFRCGCVDITSEGGYKENRQYLSLGTTSVSGSVSRSGVNKPVVAIRIPDKFKGKHNTRDLVLSRITAYADQNSIVRVFATRNGVGLTGAPATWTPVNGGNIEFSENVDTLNIAQMELILSRRMPTNNSVEINNPDLNAEFFLIHGDYIIVTIHRDNLGNVNCGCTIELSEEI